MYGLGIQKKYTICYDKKMIKKLCMYIFFCIFAANYGLEVAII